MATSHTKRSEQLEKYLKKVINNILYRKINDPRITFVTITRVSASVDLKYAKIYISIYGDENHNRNCLKALRNATKFIRREIGREAKIRFIPEIKFLIDENIEYQYKLLNIVNKIHKEQLDNKDENKK
ncbi:MAG TPA: 30S ribosome-binding factor RbfA [Candidatus Atribacteria bacterium]|nr:30S ribosome-binding factor RbfA [Candidatus Atribacteria bacterium]